MRGSPVVCRRGHADRPWSVEHQPGLKQLFAALIYSADQIAALGSCLQFAGQPRRPTPCFLLSSNAAIAARNVDGCMLSIARARQCRLCSYQDQDKLRCPVDVVSALVTAHS